MSSTASAEPRLSRADLDRLLRAADPAALLVPPRVLRRVIKRDRKLVGVGLRVPHRKSYVIGRDVLLALASRHELGIEPDRELPPTVLLLPRPELEELTAALRGSVLVKYWRLLFHARIHAVVAGRGLTDAAVRERIHRIGQVEFDEARTVLRQEKFLLPPRNDRSTYEEFAAVYLELRYFAPTLLPRYFPAIKDYDRVELLLAADVDASALFTAIRPAGTPDPAVIIDDPVSGATPAADMVAEPRVGAGVRYRVLTAHAERAAAAGNDVRAALSLARAARVAPRKFTGRTLEKADAAIGRLVRRLRPALNLTADEAGAWRRVLPALLPYASRGAWPAEARLLYDLQKVCVDHERPVYRPSLVEWAYSGFRKPLMKPLPDRPLVLAVKYLRAATARLPAVRLTDVVRHEQAALLRASVHRAEARLRERLRPQVGDVLADVGLRPTNLPERVARDKLVEELLDRVVERGYLTIGNLRDAVSRNQLKLRDLAGPGEFFTGDALLRANRGLANRAPGVYRRGEVYLRWLQRFSAAAFGTRVGRLLMRHLVLPFGGAFLAIEGPLQIAHEIGKLFGFVMRLLGRSAAEASHADHRAPLPLAPLPAILLVGVSFWLLLNVPSVRRATAAVAKRVGSGLRIVLIDAPLALFHWPPIWAVLHSWPVRLVVRYVLKPLLPALVAWVTLADAGLHPKYAAAGGALVLAGSFLFFASRLGRDIEEAATDWAVRRWEFVRDVLPGLFRLVADLFKRCLQAIDRALYTVDEWLRFRGGEGRFTHVWKMIAGIVWGGVAYVVRFIIVLFVEPQVNPIKHFPVVTISHKLLLPMVPSLAAVLEPAFGLGTAAAVTIATIIIGKVPGVFGFLVWELKENWRLYEANRPLDLRPVVIGHHGETLPRLLRPGFHSGTLPKLYARLRRAERRALLNGDWRRARRLREALRHNEEAVHHFADRELVDLLNHSPAWKAGPVYVTAVEAGSNRIRIELACPALNDSPLEVAFEEQSGWLLGHVASPGWLPRLTADQAAVLATALVGFYKWGGVDMIREQVEAALGSPTPPYDVTPDGLVVWRGPGHDAKEVHDLSDDETEDAGHFLSTRYPVLWRDWVDAWERKDAPSNQLVPGVRVLPATVSNS